MDNEQAGQQSAPPTPPAGWYRDPVDAHTKRWWDGAQWTEQTQPTGPNFNKGLLARLLGGAVLILFLVLMALAVLDTRDRDEQFHRDFCERTDYEATGC